LSLKPNNKSRAGGRQRGFFVSGDQTTLKAQKRQG